PDVNVNFVHPTDGRVLNVTVDDTMTAQEAIGELLANNFIAPSPGGYQLAVNGDHFNANQTLAEKGVTSGAKIRVDPSTDAGRC
ncbi:MAG TPA: hypothetical protein VNZ44_02890, partial [Pyrinomonadaceae bacterium]|nr:hypothetical protein [Pyrinomonadaceae bacterium]